MAESPDLASSPSTVPDSNLRSRWAIDVTPDNVLPEYPRPLLVRPEWTNLNGEWEFHVTPEGAGGDRPERFDERILVPFCPESALSGIGRTMPIDRPIWYRRTFAASAEGRTILHFGAVDWRCRVWVDGTEVGSHEGGYDPFSFDVTDALTEAAEHELVVSAFDPCDQGPQPRGKQVCEPEGIYYVPCTGIWGTVWTENVPESRISGLKITPRPSEERLKIRVNTVGAPEGTTAEIVVLGEGVEVARLTGPVDEPLSIPVAHPRLWSPSDPFLYDLVVTLSTGDRVESYCGFREVGLVKDGKGRTRLGLNGKPIFMVGPLDQGYWPEGILTAPTAEALRYDIELTQRLGFNTIRKHVKVEPAIWYAMCDRMGMLVWQDMPSGERSISPGDPDLERSPESAAIFEGELRAMVEGLYNHPSIVAWVVFNEGWGQYETERVVREAGSFDPSRINVGVTGWCDRGVGDVHDWHVYPGPASPDPEPDRAATLGEFGGLGLPVVGHMWQHDFWGYRSYGSKPELTQAFEELFAKVEALIAEPGLSAAIYTQTTDVETECNGFVTYDRAAMKLDEAHVRAAVERVLAVPLD